MMRFKASPSQYGGLFGFQNMAVGSTATEYIPMINIRSDGKLYGEVWVGGVSPNGHSLSVSSDNAVNDGNWHTVYFSSTTSSVSSTWTASPSPATPGRG